MSPPNAPDTPEWVKDAVFYQIFPDRFARSGRVTQPNNLLPWDSPPHVQKYHGGDLLGVLDKLDYLQDLGVTAIYFNPIFQSAANHRYHTHDYYKVCPLLGGNEAFRRLVDEMHRREMRVILDGVFNHASRGFFQFNDILENGPHSPWLDWFEVQDWPLAPYRGDKPANYRSWWDIRSLPEFNTENPQVCEFIMQVAEFWINEYDIDGWRLDVASEIDTPGFWEEFRTRVRAAKSDAYIVGEIWRIEPEWLQGDRFDANMNYPMASAVTAFAGGDRISAPLTDNRPMDVTPAIQAAEFKERIHTLLDAYHWQTTLVKFNILDSHDTPRLLSAARGDKDTVRLATLYQMTYPGAPSIYYGDEIALRGTTAYESDHKDEDARWPFPWQDEASWDHEMRAYFKELIALRHGHKALRRGKYETLLAEGEQYAFARTTAAQKMIIVLNVGTEKARVTIETADYLSADAELKLMFGPGNDTAVREGQVTVDLPARSGAVWLVVRQ